MCWRGKSTGSGSRYMRFGEQKSVIIGIIFIDKRMFCDTMNMYTRK